MGDESNETLIRVKADATGLDFTIGSGLPKLFYRFLPQRAQIKRGVDRAIAETVIEKIRRNEEFSEAEAAFAEHLFSDHALKYINLKRIEQRAYQLHEESRLLLEAGEEPNDAQSEEAKETANSESETSQDWVNKFREDASLVDSELIREIYARILVAEARHPNSISLRTLAVLRCMDTEVALKFNQLLSVVFNEMMVPRQDGKPEGVLSKCGITYIDLLTLDDAGLVNASTDSDWEVRNEEQVFLSLTAHKRFIRVLHVNKTPLSFNWQVHLLTPAGRQLAHIANSEPDPETLPALLEWVRNHTPTVEIAIASFPYIDWEGSADTLEWNSV